MNTAPLLSLQWQPLVVVPPVAAPGALDAGAAGFLVKDIPPTQLLAAIHAAVKGGAMISPAATRRLIDHLVTARLSQDLPALEAVDSLTARKHEVLHLLALGCSNREIATRLTISELTAKTHVAADHQARCARPWTGRGPRVPRRHRWLRSTTDRPDADGLAPSEYVP